MNQPLIALTLFAQQDDNYHSEWAQRTCCVLNDPIDLMVNGSAECTLALPRQHAPDVALNVTLCRASPGKHPALGDEWRVFFRVAASISMTPPFKESGHP